MNLRKFFSKNRTPENLQETLLSDAAWRDLIFSIEEREVPILCPKNPPKRIFEIAFRQKSLLSALSTDDNLLKISARATRSEPRLENADDSSSVIFLGDTLPFLDASLDRLLLRVAFTKSHTGKLIQEAGRVLKGSGDLILVDLHPFSFLTQKEYLKSAALEDGFGPGFERYFRWFETAGFKIKSVHETFFDGSLKKFFLEADVKDAKKAFDKIKRTPFLIFFVLSRSSLTPTPLPPQERG